MAGYTLTTYGLDLVLCLIHLEEEVWRDAGDGSGEFGLMRRPTKGVFDLSWCWPLDPRNSGASSTGSSSWVIHIIQASHSHTCIQYSMIARPPSLPYHVFFPFILFTPFITTLVFPSRSPTAQAQHINFTLKICAFFCCLPLHTQISFVPGLILGRLVFLICWRCLHILLVLHLWSWFSVALCLCLLCFWNRFHLPPPFFCHLTDYGFFVLFGFLHSLWFTISFHFYITSRRANANYSSFRFVNWITDWDIAAKRLLFWYGVGVGSRWRKAVSVRLGFEMNPIKIQGFPSFANVLAPSSSSSSSSPPPTAIHIHNSKSPVSNHVIRSTSVPSVSTTTPLPQLMPQSSHQSLKIMCTSRTYGKLNLNFNRAGISVGLDIIHGPDAVLAWRMRKKIVLWLWKCIDQAYNCSRLSRLALNYCIVV